MSDSSSSSTSSTKSFENILSLLRNDETRATVKAIDFSYGNLNDAGVEKLLDELARAPHSVGVFFLSGNLIGDAGAVAFATKLLRTSTSVHTLDLSDNQLTDRGAQALLDVVPWNKTILNVFVGGNAVSPSIKSSLNNIMLPRTENERKLKAINDVVEALKSRRDGVVEINLGGNGLVDKTHLTRILDAISSQNVPIKKLNLGYNKIDDNAVAVLAEFLKSNSTIEELQLDGNSISDVGADKLVEALKLNHTVSTLDLGDNALGDRGANALSDIMLASDKIRKLYVGGNAGVTPANAKRLASLVR